MRDADLVARPAPESLRSAIALQVARARALLASALPLVGSLRGAVRFAVAGYAAGGFAAADALRARALRPERRRAARAAPRHRAPRRRDSVAQRAGSAAVSESHVVVVGGGLAGLQPRSSAPTPARA